MTKTTKTVGTRRALNDMPSKAAIKRVLRELDGWTIFAPDFFIKAGFPEAWVKRMTVVHASDGTPKGTITTANGVVSELKGIYGLTALYTLASQLKANTKKASGFSGRGKTAQALVEAIQEVL